MMWRQLQDWDSQRREVERMEERTPFRLSVENSFRQYEEEKTEKDLIEPRD